MRQIFRLKNKFRKICDQEGGKKKCKIKNVDKLILIVFRKHKISIKGNDFEQKVLIIL
jgi:hypothetical protein